MRQHMGLLNEPPLLIMPSLAVRIGLNESIVLQQIHYWNVINENNKNNFRDGYYWTFNSVKEWNKQFPFWSKNTIVRLLNRLEDKGLVVTGNYNKLKFDRTKWYRIDYEVLNAFTTDGQMDLQPACTTIPETNTKTNKKSKRYIISETGNEVLSYYYDKYKEILKKEHPSVTKEQLDDMEEVISYYDYVEYDYDEHIEEYLLNLPKSNDGKAMAYFNDRGAMQRYIR